MALLGEAKLSDRSCKTKAFECHKAGDRFCVKRGRGMGCLFGAGFK